MQKVAEIVESLEKSVEFSTWRRSNPSAYLSSLFAMIQDAGQVSEWLVSYYEPSDDTFTTFNSVTCRASEKEQAFKKETTLPRLDLSSVSLTAYDALDCAEKVRLEKYAGQSSTKVILVLLPLSAKEIGGSAGRAETVWNITYITASFKVLNVKVSAASGKPLSDSISGIMDFMQKDK